jgi:hypothetical protein
MKNCRGRATAWKVASFCPGVPKPSTCCTMTSPRRGSMSPMRSIIEVRNWCSTSSFCGSALRETRSRSHAETRLTSPAPTEPIRVPGTPCLPIRHSGSSARPTYGSLSAQAQRLAASRKFARPGWTSSSSSASCLWAASMYFCTSARGMSCAKSPSLPACRSAMVTISS